MTEFESPYTNYLAGKSVDFEEENVVPEPQSPDSTQELTETVQKLMLADKDLIDKSQDAFVSFIRYYKEHQL